MSVSIHFLILVVASHPACVRDVGRVRGQPRVRARPRPPPDRVRPEAGGHRLLRPRRAGTRECRWSRLCRKVKPIMHEQRTLRRTQFKSTFKGQRIAKLISFFFE